MAMFIVQVSFGFQLPGLRRHKGFPISEGGGTGEMISRKGMMRLIMIKILLMVLIKLLIILTIKLIMYLVMLYVLLMMAAMIKKKTFFPVPGPLEGGKHLLLCGDDEQQPRGQTAVGVQL